MPEVINKAIQGIGFGFLHDDEIKKLSVKQVTNSQSFDSLRQPVIGGLYDRAFGTTDLFDFCDTCDLSEKDCPGHCGHIQLAVPLYDINLLDLLIKLLNSKCWHCHHLRVARLRKKSIYVQLLYLNAGQMLKAQAVADLMNQGALRSKGDKQSRVDEVLDQHLQQAVLLNAQATPVDSRLTFHILRARNELLKSFLKISKQPKCQNCGATSPSVRRDGFTKIFVQSLNSKQLQDNDKCGIKIHSILSKSQYDSEYIVASEPLSQAEQLKDKKSKKEYKKRLAQEAKKNKKSKQKASKQNDESSGSDDDDDNDNRDESDLDDIEDEFSNQTNSTSTSEALFGEGMHKLTEKANQQDEKSKSIHTTINSSEDVEETTSRLMLPNEVERHMALLWGSTDSDFLTMFFCPGTRQQIASNPYNGNDYRAFFHRVLLVPPSRFRPPRYVAGEFFEASTNASFRKIFDANEEIVRTVFNGNSTINPSAVLIGEDVELVKKQNHSHAVANAADTESKLDKLTPAARKRVVEAWISMQHELNLFFDSDKTGNHLVSGTTGGNGIKQLLEKKQGLFRKHMMGKRVNYAARSVISPDPYLHTREIGVPEIFAKTLTFPEPVTSFNYDELRQAVINGPYVHPGANSIITSQGREIKLSMQSYEERVALANRLLGKTTSEEPSKGELFRLNNITNIEKTLASELVGDTGPMVVARHLRSGDVLLVNRQPTLHKPSMMAHVARVLFGENVIRMHYANCIAEGTLVDMADGSRIPIEQVKTGEQVITWGPRNDNVSHHEIEQIKTVSLGQWKRGTQLCSVLTLDDGREIVATDDHRFLAAPSNTDFHTTARFYTLNELKNDTTGLRIVCNALTSGPAYNPSTNSNFILGGIAYKTQKSRLLALARLLGHIFSNGTINTITPQGSQQSYLYASHYFDTLDDLKSLENDIKIVDPHATMSHQTIGGQFHLQISGAIPTLYQQCGITIGHRSIPNFVGDVNTPLDVVTNFLAAFSGASDDANRYITVSDHDLNINRSGLVTELLLNDINYQSHIDQLNTTMNVIQSGFSRAGCTLELVNRFICDVGTNTESRIVSFDPMTKTALKPIERCILEIVNGQGYIPLTQNELVDAVIALFPHCVQSTVVQGINHLLGQNINTKQFHTTATGCLVSNDDGLININTTKTDIINFIVNETYDIQKVYYCVDMVITPEQSLNFHENIGIKYSVDKAAKWSLFCAYRKHALLITNQKQRLLTSAYTIRTESQTIRNQQQAIGQTRNLHQILSIKDSINQAITKLQETEHVYFDAMPTPGFYKNYYNTTNIIERDQLLQSNTFPDFHSFLSQCNFEWCSLGSSHSFTLGIQSIIKENQYRDVYDLEVDDNHNFSAGGVIVHNCNSYNADFDGDEMNLHFPQNQLARIEAYDIANNDNQYIVPTSGNPLRGLIQDHVVCGVRLTQRDTFLNREYFQQFLFLAIADRDVQNGNIIATPQPTILKPRVLWTGKQIINSVLDFVAEGRPPLNLTPTKAKIPGSSWGKQGQEDGSVIIRENNLVTGVLDKAMFGASKHGLVHAIYELYGAKAAGNMLTILARLFTRVLQYDAFTCGIEDFLLSHETDVARRLAIEQSVWDGVQATSNCAGLEGDVHTFGPNKINEAVQRLYAQHKNASEMLDNAVKAALSQNTSNIIKLCIPNGQRIPFPKNNMAMMTLSGAKGSAVNHSQIACLLGQQELEGRRVPTTMAGKTLPSFPKYDPQPRAGGYISQRFFTGIRPQEFYYHCLAEDHQILTNQGFLYGKDIDQLLTIEYNNNDVNNNNTKLLIAQVNNVTNSIEYVSPTTWVNRPLASDDQMYTITSSNELQYWETGNIKLQSNEYGIIQGTEQQQQQQREETNHISLFVTDKHDLWAKPRSNGRYAKYTPSQLPQEFQLTGYVESGLNINSAPVPRQMVIDVYNTLELDTTIKQNAFNQILGYWLNCGSIDTQANIITFFPQRETDIYYLDALFQLIGFHGQRIQNDRIGYIITNDSWVQFFATYWGKDTTTTKSMPSWYLAYSKDEASYLLHGLRFVDNTSTQQHILPINTISSSNAQANVIDMDNNIESGMITTSSLVFREQVVVLALHAGYSAYWSLDSQNELTNQWMVYYTRVESNANPTFKKENNDVQQVQGYNGRVHCVTVPTGLIITRRARQNTHGDTVYASRPVVIGNCMSGREGLVDTAVKTARSGYLQRCLIKLLEGLNIRYDNTVRDVDNSIVQFQYGEDGIDPVKAGYLTTMSFLASNFKTLMSKLKPFDALSLLDDISVDDYTAKVDTMTEELTKMRAAHQRATAKEKSKIDSITDAHKKASEITKATKACREREDSLKEIQDSLNLLAPNDTIISKFPIGKSLGSVSEKYRNSYLDYINKDPDGTFAHAALMDQRWNERLILKQNELKKKSESLKSMTMSTTSSTSKFQIIQDQITNLKEQIKILEENIENNVTPEKFTVLMNLYYMNNLAHPGENVGVLAGQSVGEPSTQMTLNTFHLAGHGGANVTLGIPRLREIVMTASPDISTPIMELPLKDPSPEAAIKLAAKLNKVKLSECLQSIQVTQTIRQSGSRQYRIRTHIKDLNSEWAVNNLITPYNIAKCIGIELARKLQTQVHTKLRFASSGVLSSRVNRGTGDIMTSAEEDASLDDVDDGVTELMDASERRKMRELEEGASEQLRADKKKQQSSYDDEESGDEEEGSDSDDDDNNNNQSKKGKKSSSDMNDIDTDDDNDEDDELFDEKGTTMTDKVKPMKKTTKKSTSSAPKPTPLTTENDLSQEQSAGDFDAFCRKLIPYWGRYAYIDEIDFSHITTDNYVDIIVVTPQGSPKLLMLSTMETICDVCRVRYTEGINKAIAIDRKLGDGRKVKIVQTDGVNFAAVTNYSEVDHSNIKTNDIHRILMRYGVEAASTAIRNEISGVFAVYGIVVDPRHLSLIADFMTFQGGYHAMNRNSISSRPSVLQKATFETSMRFILDACQSGEYDHLTSPASSIVLGKPIQSGSGCFELRHPLPTLSK